MTDTLTITAGSKEGAYLGQDGTFQATLVSITDKGQRTDAAPNGLKSEGAPPFPNRDDPTKPGYYLKEWAFAIEGANTDACIVWATSSMGTSPRSKAYGYIVALLEGRQPPVGTTFDINKHLVGREALVTVHRDTDGFMKVDAVTALPTRPVAAAAPRPVAQPAPASRAADDDLPF